MIFHPAIIALLTGSLLTCAMLAYAAGYGALIIRDWDIKSGSELQLRLEQRTYLISTIMSYGMGFQALSLFLFIFTADGLHPYFIGAMCAAGCLKVNAWGYPTLLLKVLNAILAGLWLILNRTDNRAYDYPLIRIKYALLLAIVPLFVTETILQGLYFIGLKPEIITSCCGTLFTSDAKGITADILSFPTKWVEIAFFAAMACTLAQGAIFTTKAKWAYAYSAWSGVTFLLSIVALISFVSLYFYELPTHHCPFCILHGEYHYVGYIIYLAILGGAIPGLGVGVIAPFGKLESLATIVPSMQRRLAMASMFSFAVYLGITAYIMIFSNLRLHGA